MRILEASGLSARILEMVRTHSPALSDTGAFLDFDIRYDHLIDYPVFSLAVFKAMPPGQVILHFDEWGIWPSSENWFLFDALCLHFFGRTHRLEPMLFGDDELEAARAFLQLGLQSGWGGIWVSDEHNWFCFNHDGIAKARMAEDHCGAFLGIEGVHVSADGDTSSDQIVYVRLLEEGTDVWRPVPAFPFPDGTFELREPGDYAPQDEKWEFPPRARVRCEVRNFGNGEA